MRPLLALLLAVGAAATLECARRDSRAASDTVAGSLSVANQKTSSVPGDTDIVRSTGVMTDADDTASTRYGKHQTPRRLSSPGCRPRGIALCLPDTATRVYSVDCCIADQRQADWLVFAAAHDSLQLFLEPARDAYLTMSPAN